VHPSGKFLYASNRNVDNIVICEINDDGTLSVLGHQSTKGKTPRYFNIDPTGSFLLVCNHHSNNIISYRIDLGTKEQKVDAGHLTFVSEIYAPSPSCLKFFV